MISKKGGNFLEEHIEKIVLILAALACVYPLYKYVYCGPGTFQIGGKTYSAGQVDSVINQEATQLKTRIEGEPTSKITYEPNAAKLIAKMGSSVSINTSVLWPLPS
jgi:hypothetical protein